MWQKLTCFLFISVVAGSQIHIANDNYLLERERERVKRDAGTTCPNGMTAATRNIFNQTLASGKTWDCTLESKAQAVIKECLVDNGGATDGTLKLSFPVTGTTTPEAVISQFKNALGLASSNLNSQSDVKESIGCSYAQCTTRVDILCLYSKPTTVPPLP